MKGKKLTIAGLIIVTGTLLISLIFFAPFTSNGSGSQTPVSQGEEPNPDGDTTIIDSKFTIVSSASHENLQVFLLGGETEIDDKEYVTLTKAMENGWVEVVETENVNELKINNLSDKNIFIHSGDIVKGGKQDRTLKHDVIVSANDKDVELASFCVESGRWAQRGGEDVGKFSGNHKMLSSKDLKVAAKLKSNQQAVWGEVAEQQDALTDNISKAYGLAGQFDVRENESGSSLQLTLENEKLKELREGFDKAIAGLEIDGAIGYVYAVNGEIYGADIYNNQQLFHDLWDKLKEAFIVEAIAEMDSTIAVKPLSENTILAFLNQQMDKSAELTKINDDTEMKTIENEKEETLLFSTIDKQQGNWLHFNYIKYDKEDLEEAAEPAIEEQIQYEINRD